MESSKSSTGSQTNPVVTIELDQTGRTVEEVDILRQRVILLTEENARLREASWRNQLAAEQEEEFISNTLFKKIEKLKSEMQSLAEQSQEGGTNAIISGLLKKTERLEAETQAKQQHIEQVRKEKVELENALEEEQEAVVNKLWKAMLKLEAEKEALRLQLEEKSLQFEKNERHVAQSPINEENATAPISGTSMLKPVFVRETKEGKHCSSCGQLIRDNSSVNSGS